LLNRSRGIATTALAVIVVIVIVVAGAAAYFALTSGSSSSTTPTTSTMTSSAPSTSTTPTMGTSTTPTTSTTSTTSASTTSTTLQTYSCTSSFTTATTTVDNTPQYIGLIAHFSSIQFKLSGTYNGKPSNSTFGYTSTTVQPGIYNVSASETTNSSTLSAIFIVDSNNNSVISATVQGHSLPSSYAKTIFDSSMGLLGLQQTYTAELGVFTDPAYVTNEGTSTKTYGTASFPVTTYAANSANEVVNYCGVSATITAFTIEVGTPPGTSIEFITYLHFAGTSQGETNDVTWQLVSMTVRS